MARRLKNMQDLRRYLASLINRTESGVVVPSLAGKLGYLISILTRVIEGSEIEKRLDEIEKKLEDFKS